MPEASKLFFRRANNHGFTLLVASSSYKPLREEEQIKNLIVRVRKDYSDWLRPQSCICEFLRNRKIPVLVTWAFDPSESRPAIGFNNVEAMNKLTKKILELAIEKLASSQPHKNNDEQGIAEAFRSHEKG